jgi:hypothetical protein
VQYQFRVNQHARAPDENQVIEIHKAAISKLSQLINQNAERNEFEN